MMVLENGQPSEGLTCEVKTLVNLSMWGKFPIPLWAPGARVRSQQEAMILAMCPSRETTIYSVLVRQGLALTSDLSVWSS